MHGKYVLTHTSTDAQSPEALYVSDIILLPASVQLPDGLSFQLGLQRGPAGPPHFPEIYAVRQSEGEGDSGSELRIKSSVPGILIPVSRGESSSLVTKANLLAWLF